MSPELAPGGNCSRKGHGIMSETLTGDNVAKVRTELSADLSADLMFASDRTCCVCRERGKRVQIHHVDENPSNNVADNLSVLCLECHDQTQIRGGFGKHLIAPVVRRYRDEWLQRVLQRRNEADRFAVSKMVGVKIMTNASGTGIESHENLFAYLDTIPEIKKELLAKAQPEWDLGVTARMNQANYDYIDGLQGILVGLASFYSPKVFDGEEPHAFFSTIISSRFRWHRAHAEPEGPGTGGTIVGTICGGSVIADVESMVVDMVLSLIGHSEEYSWKHWTRKWENKAT